jgi:hypothetical protein
MTALLVIPLASALLLLALWNRPRTQAAVSLVGMVALLAAGVHLSLIHI